MGGVLEISFARQAESPRMVVHIRAKTLILIIISFGFYWL